MKQHYLQPDTQIKIDQSHLDLAKDKIMMGAERKSMILSEEQKELQPIMKQAMR